MTSTKRIAQAIEDAEMLLQAARQMVDADDTRSAHLALTQTAAAAHQAADLLAQGRLHGGPPIRPGLHALPALGTQSPGVSELRLPPKAS